MSLWLKSCVCLVEVVRLLLKLKSFLSCTDPGCEHKTRSSLPPGLLNYASTLAHLRFDVPGVGTRPPCRGKLWFLQIPRADLDSILTKIRDKVGHPPAIDSIGALLHFVLQNHLCNYCKKVVGLGMRAHARIGTRHVPNLVSTMEITITDKVRNAPYP